MTKILAAALALGLIGWAASASANCPGHEQSATNPQTVVQGGPTTLPITPAPETKTGG
jgi:hypothetical protein